MEGVLTPKRSPNSARRRIFDGASEAKLIALACSTPPEGFARWTLQMLERGGSVCRYIVSVPISGFPAGWYARFADAVASRRAGVARLE